MVIIIAIFGNFSVKLYLDIESNGLNPDFIISEVKFLIVDGFWIFGPLEPRIYGFYYTKILQNKKRKYMGSS